MFMKSASRTVLVLVAVFSMALSASAQQKPGIAVLTFDPTEGITDGEARFLTDRFSSLLQQTGKFDVLARSRINELLQMANFTRTERCSATDCAIEAGKILSVRFVVFGTVGRMAELYSLNTSLVDVETGRILRSAIADHKGSMTDFADLAAGRNLKELLGLQEEPQASTIVVPRPAPAPATTPTHVPRPVVPTPPPALEPPGVGVLFGPRAGLSMYTGMIGLELQIHHLGIGVGALPVGPCGGVKLYFSDKGDSAFLGLSGFVLMGEESDDPRDDGEDATSYMGFIAGYRWGGRGWSFSLGAGLGVNMRDDAGDDDPYDDSDDASPVFPFGDISVGYMF
ncbi:MAG: hypothetical protein FJ224_08060 [Lentisphaerae bacterium]|nr:hypothetical protein [Lentisphaerota bacterium]